MQCINFLLILYFQLLYGPTNVVIVETIMERLAQDHLQSNRSSPALVGFANFSLLNDYYNSNSDNVFAGLWFSNSDFSNFSSIEYSISMDNWEFMDTEETDSQANDASKDYIKEGELTVLFV